jgi:hypothetical protein
MEIATLRNAESRLHPFDICVAWISARSKLFSNGWGDEGLLANVEELRAYLDSASAPPINWYRDSVRRGPRVKDGSFVSPLDLLPKETAVAHVRAWERTGNNTACLLLAASRDEGYKVRERVFGSLIDRGLNLYLLENAYYGLRRTEAGPSVRTVSDHVLMTAATLCESRALLLYLKQRYPKLVVAGYSMGGHMAALTAAVSPEPVACAALATGASAAAVYTRGLLHWSVDFRNLPPQSPDGRKARQRLHQLFLPADITQHPPPMRVDAAVIAGCQRDAYILQSETERLYAHWKGSTLRWLQSGHFSAPLTCRRSLCEYVLEAAAKL